MMRPNLYRAACAAFMGHMGGDLIDHDPDAAQDEKGERLRRTREVYRILFGHEAPYKIWQSITSGKMSLCVKTLTGKITKLLVDPKTTVENLKARIQVNSNMKTLCFFFTPWQSYAYD